MKKRTIVFIGMILIDYIVAILLKMKPVIITSFIIITHLIVAQFVHLVYTGRLFK